MAYKEIYDYLLRTIFKMPFPLLGWGLALPSLLLGLALPSLVVGVGPSGRGWDWPAFCGNNYCDRVSFTRI